MKAELYQELYQMFAELTPDDSDELWEAEERTILARHGGSQSDGDEVWADLLANAGRGAY